MKAYRPKVNSMSSGQVLTQPYTFVQARNVVAEMADSISLKLVEKRLTTDQLVLNVNYDRECLTRPDIAARYNGEVVTDWYGRQVPKGAHGTINLDEPTSSSREIIDAVTKLYDNIVNRDLLIRRLNICTNHVVPEEQAMATDGQASGDEALQLDLFTDYEAQQQKEKARKKEREKERRMQEAILNIKHRFGKNAILRGTSYADGATARERNNQIGGHRK